MFFGSPYIYYGTFVLQAICAIHCLRKGNSKWIWLIIFLPVIGCIAYLFTEVFNRNQINQVQSGMAAIIRPNGNIRRLEEQLKFTDTFNNRVLLADAYFNAGDMAKAIGIYEGSLTGAFIENEHVLMQLVVAYYNTGRYQDVVDTAIKIYRRPQFGCSRAHMFYALALEKTGNTDRAENEFKSIKGKFSYYESRYEYGLFLARNNRAAQAHEIFSAIMEEATYLNGREKSQYKIWFSKTKEALQKINV